MSTPQRYIYAALESPTEIRLLLLQPSQHAHDPLKVQIRHYDLARRMKKADLDTEEDWTEHVRHDELLRSQWTHYEAVSYAWGHEHPSIPLTVDDCASPTVLMIRPNVDLMLRHLRSERITRHLWIDALCIDQTNAREREAQVQCMGQIYEGAESVLVWLGPSEGGLEGIADAFRDMTSISSLGWPNRQYADTCQTLTRLLKRPWFRRRWTVQEVLLAKVANVLCGAASIDFMVFTNSLWVLFQQKQLLATPIELVRKLCTIYRLRISFSTRGRPAALALLVVFHTAECSDDRDRIYALDSLTEWRVPVSYSDPVETSYLNYAIKHIEYGNTALLNCCGAFRSKSKKFPSWVPDWRSLPQYVPVTTTLVLTKDLHDIEGQVDLAGSRPVLRTKGKMLSKVVDIGAAAPFPVQQGDLLKLINDWCILHNKTYAGSHKPVSEKDHLIHTITLGSVEHADEAGEQPSSSVLAHLCDTSSFQNILNISPSLEKELSGLTFSPRLWFDFDLTLYSSILGSMSRNEARQSPFIVPFDRSPKDFVQVLLHTIGGRTCFRTDGGSFGIGPAAMQSGDVIVEFPGGATPYVLRESSSFLPRVVIAVTRGNFVRRTCFTVVGDCYIHSFAPGRHTAGQDCERAFDIV